MAMERTRDSIASATASQRVQLGKEKADEAETQELGSSFANLPSSIITHILLQLPIKSVSICKCVCRTWNALISDPYFATLHFERAPHGFMIRTSDLGLVSRTLHFFEYEPENFDNNFVIFMKFKPKFKLPLRNTKLVLDQKDDTYPLLACKPEDDKFGVVNSCNGLLCLCDPRSRDHFVVCNPVTGEFIRLPESTNTDKTREPICAGLGFQPKTNEYKVIRMWKRHVERLESTVVVVEMHTLGTPTWRIVGANLGFSFSKLEFPTCVNGALHWINIDGRTWSILCFNFESERFESFPSPPHVNDKIKYKGHTSMVEVRGFLFICDASSCNYCAVWLMKKYGIGESWTKVFSTDNLGGPRGPRYCDGLCWPVKHVGKGVALLVQESFGRNCYIYFEPEKHGSKFFWLGGAPSKSYEVFPHIPSFISLKDVVKGNNIEVLNVHSRCAKFKLPEEFEVPFRGYN